MTRVASYLRVSIVAVIALAASPVRAQQIPLQVGVAQILHLTENGYTLVKP
jgi:hypothetical protein